MEAELKPLQVNQNLLMKTKPKNKDTISSKNQFDQLGGNSFIEIDPPIVKFTGYELDKPNSIIVKILNKAPIAQRVHILPNANQNFSVKLDKKGVLAGGMNETLQVIFKSSQYKYFYETLKINTETDNFLIPMHAYPALNMAMLRQIFPKVVDFGAVELNQTESNKYVIPNKLPLNFQYEIVTIKNCEEFQISQRTGIIPAKGSVQIEIKFTPKDKITYSMEIELRISQFDFENMRIKLVGNGKLKDQKKRPSSKIRVLNNPNKMMTTTHNKLRGSVKELMKGPPTNNGMTMPKLMQSTRKFQKSQLVDEFKRANEKQYLDRYNEITSLDKEKDIKFMVYNGDAPMTTDQINKFNEKRLFEANLVKSLIQRTATERHQIQRNKGLPEIEHSRLPAKQPDYSIGKNDDLKKRRNLLKILMEAGSKVLIQIRLMKRLKKIRRFLEGCSTKEQVQAKIHLDHQAASQMLSSGQEYVKFTFDSSNLFQISTYPLQFTENTMMSEVKPFLIDPDDQFDDYKSVQNIVQEDIEIMGYLNIQNPAGFVPLNKLTPPLRVSCEEEFPFRGPTLPQIKDLNVIKRSKTFELPLHLPSHQFIIESSSKAFKREALNDEKSIEYLFQDDDPVDDELVGWSKPETLEVEVMKARFMRNPGCEFTTLNGYVNSQIDFDVALYHKIDKHCPKVLKDVMPDDPFSENDSDNDEHPNIPVVKGEEIVKKVEGDNKQVGERRAAKYIINDKQQAVEKMVSVLDSIKRKQLAVAVTRQAELNKWAKQKSVII